MNKDNDFNPWISMLMCGMLKEDIQMLNDRIDVTTEPTYFFINSNYFYNILLTLHINENVRYIRHPKMKQGDFVHIVKRDTFLKMNGGKDILDF